ncbi:isochorismatase family protein, partial [Escherichia sp. TWPC-MK]
MAIPKLQAYALPESHDIPKNKVDWAFEPQRAALLIHDMQDYFVSFWGENCPMMEQVIANIAALRDYCKQHNIPVYYTAQPKEQSDEDRALLNDMWGPGLTRSPEQHNASAFDANGFYCSGDLISIDPEGYITVQGREKDQINRGGEKIAAEEIENLLLRHPAVI